MILTKDVLVELVTGGPYFEEFARAVEKVPEPAVTTVTLVSLVRLLYDDYDLTFNESVEFVERLLGEIGAQIVSTTYEMALGAAGFGGRLAPGETFSIDDAFAFAAATHLRTQALSVVDILGLDGRGEKK